MSLLDLGLVGDGGQQKVVRNLVNSRVVVGKNQRSVGVVLRQQVRQDAQFALGSKSQPPRLTVREHGGAALLRARALAHKTPPTLKRSQTDAAFAQKGVARGDAGVVTGSFVGRKLDLELDDAVFG